MKQSMARLAGGFAVSMALTSWSWSSVAVESQDPTRLELAFSIEGVENVWGADGRWLGITVPEFITVAEETLGTVIPFRCYLVGVPEGSQVAYDVSDISYYKIDAYTHSDLVDMGSGFLRKVARRPVDLMPGAYLRYQYVVPVRVSPLVYDEPTGELRVYTGFRLTLTFAGPPAAPGVAPGPRLSDKCYESVYEACILNYEQARAWRRISSQQRGAADYFDSHPWIKIKVDTSGMYCLTGQDLRSAGMSLGSVSPATLRLYSGGGLPLSESLAEANASWMRQVAIRVTGSADGTLDSGDSVFFYGLGLRDWLDLYDPTADSKTYYKSLYADSNCYWLTWGGPFSEPARRMTVRDLPPCLGCDAYQPSSFSERIHREVDFFPDFSVGAEDGWYWRPFGAGDLAFYTVGTPSPDTDRPAVVKLRFADWHDERTDCPGAYFRVVVRVNDSPVADAVWRALSTARSVYDVADTTALAGADQQLIEINRPRTLPPPNTGKPICDDLYLAWYEIFYWRKFLARGNCLFFTAPDTTATVKYVVGGYTAGGVYGFDVSDQFNPQVLRGFDVSQGATFIAALHDTTREASLRRYAFLSKDALLKPARMSQATVPNIRHRAGGAYCIVTDERLLEAANAIADYHEGKGATAEVATVDQIYDEFGWGVPDVTALRDFLRWRYESAGGLGWVLLLGDASWDYKGRLEYVGYPNYVPTYEKRFLAPIRDPYCTDDWLAYLVPAPGRDEAFWPTVPIGRMPAASSEEAEAMVAKTIEYGQRPELGVWQNRVVLVADDDRVGSDCRADVNRMHTIYAEQLADGAYPDALDIKRVYLTEYDLEPSGLKTAAKRDFVDAFNSGVLVSNYIGHGDERRLAQEEVFNPAAIALVDNGGRQNFFIAATCNVSRFDEPALSSMAEDLFRMPDGGTIGSLAATHLCQPFQNQILNRNFVEQVFSAGGKYPTTPVGDAMMLAKILTVGVDTSFYRNSEMYALLCDPLLTLASPALDVTIEAASDTLVRKAAHEFTGTVNDASGLADWFDGTVEVRVREAEDTSGYWTCSTPQIPSSYIDYEIPGQEFYRGRGSVTDGRFSFRCFVPVDAAEGAGSYVSAFVTNGQVSGSGMLRGLSISGAAVSGDEVGPQISVHRLGLPIESGDTVAVGQALELRLTDESGVAVKGKSDFIPTVSVAVDGEERADLSDSVYAVGAGITESRVAFTLPAARVGWHKLNVSAFDNLNNLTSVDYDIYVESQAGREKNLVYVYPNPAADVCYIVCEYERQVKTQISIYTVSGRKIWQQAVSEPDTYHEVPWDGTDMLGDRVANGTYIVRVEAEDASGTGFALKSTAMVSVIR